MRVMLKGIHTTKKKLADGSERTYYYAWKNGPRIVAEPGTPAFLAEFSRLHADAKKAPEGTMAELLTHFKAVELPLLKPSTQRDYRRYIGMIENEFGTLPIEAIEDRGSRGLFMEWRDRMAATPRKADLAWSVLQRVLSIAVDRERIMRNPCEGGGRLAETGTRREIIWTDEQIAKFAETAPKHVYHVFLIALWTGQRQGDILRLKWSNYTGSHINLRQSKTGKKVTVKVSRDLKMVLDMKRAALAGTVFNDKTILVTSNGGPWTSDGFRASWRTALIKADIKGVNFHDLRGTFITKARKAGSAIDDIAAATGHSTNEVRSVLEEHYLADDNTVSDGVILKLERKGK